MSILSLFLINLHCLTRTLEVNLYFPTIKNPFYEELKKYKFILDYLFIILNYIFCILIPFLFILIFRLNLCPRSSFKHKL